ncbi:DUF5686 and carboxypeptidase regulatory-like domain-containing protein [Draconibacterium sp. IB214405]|uniref:DUF5686 and carboxypeptidase regulatory-like domain-containing protein n=1 Tax=Draconibacterium sp. IB214405 TaxID=3097352 RepID=UPI002A15D5E5|nr:DUF5686 and carboxypeptidase regulatory-like domain-containing protein [Draconibacterium sp. IB214405]MDX8339675.1 DUF5686 and carboxypeptidase regulatory-like domain-containing protein [Draconibacterium sp. IB214405]
MYTQKIKQLSKGGLRLCITLILLLTSTLVNGQVLSGKILDSGKKPIPYATIYIAETRQGTTSNKNGDFSFNLSEGTYHLTIRSMGYEQADKTINLQTDSLFIPVILKFQNFELAEIKVFPGDEDPAYFIIRKAIAKAPYYRGKIKHYSADLYIKSNFAFTNIPNLIKKQEVEDGRKFKDYFKENVTYVIESQNRITFDYPDQYNQKVISKKSSLTGFDEPPVMGLMTASFYDERPNEVISPLSVLALKHYNFVYEGFITVGEFDVFKIRVTPKRKSDELVEGFIYIVDKLWCIYNLDFSSSFEFFNYHIKQQFENLGDGNWLPVSHNINGDFGMLGLTGQFYYGASVKYDSIANNYVDERYVSPTVAENQEVQPARAIGEKEKQLAKELTALNAKEELSNADVKKVARLNRKILKEQYKDTTIVTPEYGNYQILEEEDSLQNDVVWDTVRSIPLTEAEVASYRMADSLKLMKSGTVKDSTSGKETSNGFWGKLFAGSYDICKDSTIRIGYDGLLSPVNFDFNAVDGYKYRQELQIRFLVDSTKRIYLTPQVGYAFNRKSVFGSVNTRFVNFLGDGNQIGIYAGKQSNDFKGDLGITPAVNALSSWFFGENYSRFYENEYIHLNFSQRFKKYFRMYAGVNYDHFYPLENNISFPLSDYKDFEPNLPGNFTADNPALIEQKSFSYTVGMNLRKSQRKPWMEESPFLFMNDFYEFDLSFKQGIPDILNATSDFTRIDFSVHQQANITPSAGIDWQLNAGYYFNADQLHFSQFKHFGSAEIPLMLKPFTHRFQLVDDYLLSTNESYLNVMAEFRSEYLLLRYFSILNKRTWSESLHLNYLTTPEFNNYWEVGYSLNNLFFAGNVGVFAGFNESDFERIQVKLSISVFD